MNNIKITVVIPVRDCYSNLSILLDSIEDQLSYLHELIIVDSSIDCIQRDEFWNKYHSSELWTNKIQFYFLDGGLPGASRNLGIKLSTGNWISFLDCKSVVSDNYFNIVREAAKSELVDAIYGKCIFYSVGSKVAIACCALSYGYGTSLAVLPVLTLKKSLIGVIGDFRPDLRSGEDLIFMDLLKNTSFIVQHVNAFTYYRSFPDSINSVYKKWSLYSLHLEKSRRKNYSLKLTVIFWCALIALTPFYPNVSIFALVLYLSFRAYFLAIIRSKSKSIFLNSLSFYFILPIVAIAMDFGKIGGFFSGKFSSIKMFND